MVPDFKRVHIRVDTISLPHATLPHESKDIGYATSSLMIVRPLTTQ
jgi:hypothetical protein